MLKNCNLLHCFHIFILLKHCYSKMSRGDSIESRVESPCALVGDGGFLCGGLKPPLAVGASQICQWASLLKPATQRRLDVTVDVPVKVKTTIKHTSRIDPFLLMVDT